MPAPRPEDHDLIVKAVLGSKKEQRIHVDNNHAIQASELMKKMGVVSFDPGYVNTAVCTSKITYIDGDKGILRYRGYPIEDLAERSSFLEVAFLLLYGELPTASQLKHFVSRISSESSPHTDIIELIHTLRYNSHSMAVMVSSLAAMGALYPEANPALSGANIYKDKAVREAQVFRLLGAFPAIAAHFLLRRTGSFPQPIPAGLDPSNPFSYTERYLAMMGLGKAKATDERPDPRVVRALDTLLILHADHELNCSTAAVRHLTTSGVDVYTAVSGATGALYGPLHGGATEAVLRMLESIGSVNNIPNFIAAVKARKVKLMGFGHRVYRSYDPRAKIVRKIAYDVFEIYGADPLIKLAVALEEAARADDFFVSRKLFPNIDFYSGLIYKAIGFPTDYFPVLFTMGRMAGWLSHWDELCENDAERKIVRPKQIYIGAGHRSFVEIGSRSMEANGYDPSKPIQPGLRARL